MPLEHTIEKEDSLTREALRIENLNVKFEVPWGWLYVLRNVSFSIRERERVGLVGESGSGKSTVCLSLMKYLASNGKITSGRIIYRGRDILQMTGGALRALRGNKIAMIYQDPENSLNPSLTIGFQIAEVIQLHKSCSRQEAWKRAIGILERVNIPDPEASMRKYPHQLSGGQNQRVVISMAISCDPDLLILDEPTTALDVTTEVKILDLIEDLVSDSKAALLYITHDLGIISRICDKIAVMYAGEIVEEGSVNDIFKKPSHPYTIGLINCIPKLSRKKDRLHPIRGFLPDLSEIPEGCIFRARCSQATSECAKADCKLESINGRHKTACRRWKDIAPVQPILEHKMEGHQGETKRSPRQTVLEVVDLKKYYGRERFWTRLMKPKAGESAITKAVDGLSFIIHKNETFALVGESGCGKTTIGECIVRLREINSGRILFKENDVLTLGKNDKNFRKRIGIVFQNPNSSLNPRKTVEDLIGRPLEFYNLVSTKNERKARIRELLERVNLSESYAKKSPGELSGGEAQRVAIAVAFAAEPELVICDEPTSALDVSVQAAILNLLMDLQESLGTSYLFISHNLSVVRHIANRTAIMYLGKLMEIGKTEDVFSPPYHPYTRTLLSAISIPDPNCRYHSDTPRLKGVVPSAKNPPPGCKLQTRCPEKLGDICEREEPPCKWVNEEHAIYCHKKISDLMASTHIQKLEAHLVAQAT